MSEQDEMRDALRRAIQRAGGPTVVGRHFSISQQAVGQWDICPPARVLGLERISGVSRHDLRSDMYPVELGTVAHLSGSGHSAAESVACERDGLSGAASRRGAA